MDFADSARSVELQQRMRSFLNEVVYPAELVYEVQADANRAAGTPFTTPAVLAKRANVGYGTSSCRTNGSGRA